MRLRCLGRDPGGITRPSLLHTGMRFLHPGVDNCDADPHSGVGGEVASILERLVRRGEECCVMAMAR